MTLGLSVQIAVVITDAMLTSTTVAEDDAAEWNSGTTYAVDALVISTTTHRIYRSLRAANTNHDPTVLLNTTGEEPWWLDMGPTNAWKIFDGERSSATEASGTMTYVVKPGQFVNSLIIFGLDGEQIDVTGTADGEDVYDFESSLESSAPDDYYEHCFGPFKPQRDLVLADLPPYLDLELTITITGSGTVKCGWMGLGMLTELGDTRRGAKTKPKTYAYIRTNEYGETEIRRRRSSKDVSMSAWVKLENADAVAELLQDVQDVVCAWLGTDANGYAGLRALGLGKGELSYDYPGECLLTVDVTGVI